MLVALVTRPLSRIVLSLAEPLSRIVAASRLRRDLAFSQRRPPVAGRGSFALLAVAPVEVRGVPRPVPRPLSWIVACARVGVVCFVRRSCRAAPCGPFIVRGFCLASCGFLGFRGRADCGPVWADGLLRGPVSWPVSVLFAVFVRSVACGPCLVSWRSARARREMQMRSRRRGIHGGPAGG